MLCSPRGVASSTDCSGAPLSLRSRSTLAPLSLRSHRCTLAPARELWRAHGASPRPPPCSREGTCLHAMTGHATSRSRTDPQARCYIQLSSTVVCLLPASTPARSSRSDQPPLQIAANHECRGDGEHATCVVPGIRAWNTWRKRHATNARVPYGLSGAERVVRSPQPRQVRARARASRLTPPWAVGTAAAAIRRHGGYGEWKLGYLKSSVTVSCSSRIDKCTSFFAR